MNIANDSSPPFGKGELSDTPQFAMLDFFIPGFSVFSAALKTYLGIDLNLYIPLIAVVCAAIFSWKYLNDYFWSLVDSYLMSSVRIRTDDEIYNMIMSWVARQKFSQRSRRFIVNTNINSRVWFMWRYNRDDDEDEDGPDSKKKALQYTPSFGSHFFWYKGHLLLFERHENREQAGFLVVSEREHLSVSCFGRNPAILKELLIEARLEYMKKDEDKTLIYRGAIGNMNSDPSWQRCMSRSSRPFSTVILSEKTKQELIDDVTDYLNPATRRWYANRGIPYRRGYLLYGPPGTGKSSLSLALAGYFRMRIYMVSLSSVLANEENLSSLFAELPRRCVVLLEDIDSAGLTHTREENGTTQDGTAPATAPAAPVAPGKPGAPPPQLPGRLSLSGLLNILDGVASQEGRILIMTTNHLEKLDKALIRPGRVDMTVKFGLADTEMTAAIFSAIYAPYEGEVAPGSGPSAKQATPDSAAQMTEEAEKAAAEAAKKREETTARVEVLAKEFAARIPPLEFSPAEIQGLLLRNKRDPEGVVDKVEEWMIQTRKDRKEKEAKDAEKRKKELEELREAEEKKKEKEEKRKARKKRAGRGKKNDDDSDNSNSESSSDSEESDEEAKPKKKTRKSTAKKAKKDTEEGDSEKKAEKEDKAETETTEKKTEDAEQTKTEETAEVKADEDDTKGKKSPSDSGYDT